MAEQDGFAALAAELERMSDKITSDSVKRKAFEAGAEPIVKRARQTVHLFRRKGQLEGGVGSSYDSRTQTQDIGWDNNAFYGRFYENGYRPTTGNLKRIGKRRKWTNKRPSGKFIQRVHLSAAYNAERENAGMAMIEVLKNELGGS